MLIFASFLSIFSTQKYTPLCSQLFETSHLLAPS
jgi:hypothetical protein